MRQEYDALMAYPEHATHPDDEPREAVKPPPLVAAATDLHEVETSLASLSERMHDLEEQRHRMLDKRQALRASLADLLQMSDHETTEARPARPTF